jgi:hypothetical protein
MVTFWGSGVRAFCKELKNQRTILHSLGLARQIIIAGLDFDSVNFSSSKTARFLFVPLLSLWLAGGCMLGCGGIGVAFASALEQSTVQASPERAVQIVVSEQSCASGAIAAGADSSSASHSHHCCKKNRTQAARKTQPDESDATSIGHGRSSSGMMSDCPLAANKSAVVTENRKVEASASQALARSYRPEPVSSEHRAPLFDKSLLPNRGHTYLRCCVFLI